MIALITLTFTADLRDGGASGELADVDPHGIRCLAISRQRHIHLAASDQAQRQMRIELIEPTASPPNDTALPTG